VHYALAISDSVGLGPSRPGGLPLAVVGAAESTTVAPRPPRLTGSDRLQLQLEQLNLKFKLRKVVLSRSPVQERFAHHAISDCQSLAVAT